MHILIATDAQWVLDEVVATLDSPSVSFAVVTDGRKVVDAVRERTPDIAVLDMQVGNMGAMAITMDLRLDQSSGALPSVPVLVLLDRVADVHMARRSGANGWIIKPLDSLRLRKAVTEVAAGGCHAEGCHAEGITQPADALPAEPTESAEAAVETADSLA